MKHFLNWDSEEEAESRNGIKDAIRFEIKKFIVGLHPHIAIRYAPVVDQLNLMVRRGKAPSVLEVGSGSLGVTRFWHHPATGIDVNFEGSKLGFLRQVKGSALRLPFNESQFQYVISVDMLEHLPKADRGKAIAEMIRVASDMVIIALPCGQDAVAVEERAKQDYQAIIAKHKNAARKKELIRRSHFLYEHGQHDFPVEEEILDSIKRNLQEQQTNARVRIMDNESTWAWRFLLPSVIAASWPKALLIKSIALFFMPFLKRTACGGFYRKVFFIDKNSKP